MAKQLAAHHHFMKTAATMRYHRAPARMAVTMMHRK